MFKQRIFLICFFLLLISSCVLLRSTSKIVVRHNVQEIVFSIIGDFGSSGSNEAAVAKLVKSWSPNFIVTLGDNNYPNGWHATIDENIGQYYSDFIYPYKGRFGSGSSDQINRFFPALGNHDWNATRAKPYLDYFQLPGNERYYDFVWGPVHFFCIDSDRNEPHGNSRFSAQARWLKKALTASKAHFKIVYFHHPPYSSSSVHGSAEYMQWPFQDWGASIVVAGHDHVYERLSVNNLPYIVNGLGGKSIYEFGPPLRESLVRYNKNYGALKVTANLQILTLEFYSISDGLIDKFTIVAANPEE